MGTWGHKPWQDDSASDWYRETFDSGDFDAQITKALRYDDQFGLIRAAGYLLATLGRSQNIWPGDPKKLDEHIALAKSRLMSMTDPEGEYMELWGKEDQILKELEAEVALLEGIENAEKRGDQVF